MKKIIGHRLGFFLENIRDICQFFLKKLVIFQKYEVLKKKYIKTAFITLYNFKFAIDLDKNRNLRKLGD